MHPYKKNPPNWAKDEILNEMETFIPIYKTRPIKKNYHGMRQDHP